MPLEDVEKILSEIDCNFSKSYELVMLKFIAQAVVPHEQLKPCDGVPEVYRKIDAKFMDYRTAVALLRHMLKVSGCKRENELKRLSAHCPENLDLTSAAPLLPFYELLLLLGRKLNKKNNYQKILDHIDEDKLNMSKQDLRLMLPVDMLQSMICKGTIDPRNLHSLREELVLPLRAAELIKEAVFLEQSLVFSHSNSSEESRTVVVTYFNYEGELQKPSTSQLRSGAAVWAINNLSMRMESLRNELESFPLLGDWNERQRRLRASPRCKSTVTGLSIICIFSLLVLVAFIAYCFNVQVLHHTQPVYERITFSPFNAIRFPVDLIEGKVIYLVDDPGRYPLTICQAECPLKTHLNFLPSINNHCSEQNSKTCYARTNNYSTGTYSQDVSVYMLKESMVTFKVTSNMTEALQLCITNDADKCESVFMSENNSQSALSRDCHQLTILNESSNYTHIFTAREDGYYCAVWILNSKDQRFNYRTTSRLRLYSMTDYNTCSTFDISQPWTYSLQSSLTSRCIIVHMETEDSYFRGNFTVNTATKKVINDTLSIVIMIVTVILIVFLLLLPIFVWVK